MADAVALSETRVAVTLSDDPDTHAAQDTVVRLMATVVLALAVDVLG